MKFKRRRVKTVTLANQSIHDHNKYESYNSEIAQTYKWVAIEIYCDEGRGHENKNDAYSNRKWTWQGKSVENGNQAIFTVQINEN
jgi:hypothetical protein